MSTPTADHTPEPSTVTCGSDQAEQRSRISCPCGFQVVGFDEDTNVAAFESHPCPNRRVKVGPRWYSYAFGFWGWAIVATVLYAVVAVFLHRLP